LLYFPAMNRRGLPVLLLLGTFLVTVAVACGSSGDDAPTKPQFAFGLDAQVLASGADATGVRAIEFAPDGRIFYAEQFSGQVRIVNQDGTLQVPPFVSLQVANYLDQDWGLTGLALDPNFATNHYVYVFYTAPVSEFIGRPTIVRYTDTNGTGTDQRTISDDFPETFANHQGYNANGEIHFGPDGFLYASVGDYDQGTAKPEDGGHPELVSDLSSPIGKMLRLNKADGTAAAGNPFEAQAGADPRVFAYGFREPFSFTFDSAGTLYGTDNTTVSCEELNVIEPGKNYGWPTGWTFPFDNCAVGQGEQPVYNYAREGKQPADFLSFVETQGITVLKGSKYGQLTDGIVVCQSEKSKINDQDPGSPGALVRFVLNGPKTVTSSDIIVRDCKGAAAAHDGELYFANGTSLMKVVAGAASGTAQQVPPS
jgi:glucose/arabinose dehydrogenase